MANTIVNSTDTINTWKEKTNDISADLGDIVLLTTDQDSDLVGAVNSIDSNLGARETLTTIDKTSIVAAINEHDAELGDSALTTTAQTIRGAINEHDAEIGDSALTTTGQTLRSAINEHDAEIGNMTLTGLTATDLSAAARELRTELGDVTTLTTAEKTNTVGAIVEIVDRVDSLDALLDQPVLRTSAVNFTSVTTGDTVLTTNGITHPLTYTVDAGANIILDAASAGGVIMRRSGVTKFTFKDSGSQHQVIDVTGTMHLHAGDDIRLDAGGGDWILEDANITQFQFSGVGVGNKRMSIPTGNFEIDTQAATGQINLQAGASGKVVHSAGGTEMMNFTTGSINRTGSLTIDASANITLDADGGNVYFKDGGATQMTFTGGTNKQIVVASGDLTVDAPGNVTIDADGGNVYFTGLSGNNQFLFAGGVNKEIDIPTGNLTIDVAGDVNIDAGGGDVVFKDSGATTLTFTGGTVSRTGTFTIDASTNVVLDAGGGNIILRDDGSQYGSFVSNNNELIIKSGNDAALTFSSQINNTRTAVQLHGPLFADSDIWDDPRINSRDDITQGAVSTFGDRSITGQIATLYLNFLTIDSGTGDLLYLDTQSRTLVGSINELRNDYIGGDLGLLNTTDRTSLIDAINELDSDVGNKTSLTTSAKTNLVAAVNELDADIGNKSLLTTANKTNLVAAVNEIDAWTTTDLPEGNNLYFTTTRARSSIGVTSSTGLSYNSSTGVLAGVNATKSVKGVASFDSDNFIVSSGAVRLRIGATNSGTGYGSLSYDSDTSVFTFNKVTSANIRGNISASNSGTGYGGVAYDNTTGILTYTKVTDADIRSRFSGTSPVSISAGGVISVNDASTTTKGIASFDSNKFTVSNGVVSLSVDGLQPSDLSFSKLAKIQTADRVLGSYSANGTVSEVQIRGGMIQSKAVTNDKLTDATTTSTVGKVLGRTKGTAGVADWIQVDNSMIADGAVNTSKLSGGGTTLTIKNSSGTTVFTITGVGA
jgi:hypothetical protein